MIPKHRRTYGKKRPARRKNRDEMYSQRITVMVTQAELDLALDIRDHDKHRTLSHAIRALIARRAMELKDRSTL